MLQCISQVFPEKQNRMCVCVCVCVCRKKIKNTVMLADDCMSQSAGGRGPGDSVAPVWRPAGWRFRKNWYFSLNSKAGKNNNTDTNQWQAKRNSLLFSLFALFRPSTDQVRVTHVRESNLLSQPIQMFIWIGSFKCSSRASLTDTPK